MEEEERGGKIKGKREARGTDGGGARGVEKRKEGEKAGKGGRMGISKERK